LVPVPRLVQRFEHKQPADIIGQHPDAKKYRIDLKLAAGHPFHAKTDLKVLDPVLAALSSLIIPLHQALNIFRAIGCHRCIPFGWHGFIEQLGLHGAPDHYQTKRPLGVVHTMHSLGNKTVLVNMPIIVADAFDLSDHRLIKICADGILYPFIITVVEYICLMTRLPAPA
jgi:hypothetical protein